MDSNKLKEIKAKILDIDEWQIKRIDTKNNYAYGSPDTPQDGIAWIGNLEPADPPECLCEARKREEEAGSIWREQLLNGERGTWVRSIKGGIVRGRDCIHCGFPLKKSLLGGQE